MVHNINNNEAYHTLNPIRTRQLVHGSEAVYGKGRGMDDEHNYYTQLEEGRVMGALEG